MSDKVAQDYQLIMQGTVSVWAKGQIVIPKKVRTRLHIEEGNELIVFTRWDTAIWLIKSSDIALLRTYLDTELETRHQT